MEDNIRSTTILGKDEKYTLLDKDFLLIEALRDLAKTIERLRLSLITK